MYECSVPSDLRERENYSLRFEQFDSVDIYRESLPFSTASHQKSSNESTDELYRNGENISLIVCSCGCAQCNHCMFSVWECG